MYPSVSKCTLFCLVDVKKRSFFNLLCVSICPRTCSFDLSLDQLDSADGNVELSTLLCLVDVKKAFLFNLSCVSICPRTCSFDLSLHQLDSADENVELVDVKKRSFLTSCVFRFNFVPGRPASTARWTSWTLPTPTWR